MHLDEVEQKVQKELQKWNFKEWRNNVVSSINSDGQSRNLSLNEDSVYPHICAYAKLINCQHFLELGTREGGLATLISHIAKKTTVVDVDYTHWRVWQQLPNLVRKQISPEQCSHENWYDYDCIFVDIDHNGVYEPVIHKSLIDSGYKGIVLWDDIGYVGYSLMNEWWDSVTLPKRRLNWHNNYFGVIQYDN